MVRYVGVGVCVCVCVLVQSVNVCMELITSPPKCWISVSVWLGVGSSFTLERCHHWKTLFPFLQRSGFGSSVIIYIHLFDEVSRFLFLLAM